MVTLSCGMLEMPWKRFFAFDVVAGLVWGTYAAMLGYVGGRTFEENPFRGFLLAFVVALGVAGDHRGVPLVPEAPCRR